MRSKKRYVTENNPTSVRKDFNAPFETPTSTSLCAKKYNYDGNDMYEYEYNVIFNTNNNLLFIVW